MSKVDFGVKRVVLDEPALIFLQSLKVIRQGAGLTKQALADAVGIARSNIVGYETTRKLPSVATLIKLAEVLEYDLSQSVNYKLYHGEIKPVWLRYQLKLYGFNYAELSRMTGYSLYSVRNCFIFSRRITPQCLHAVLRVLEREIEAAKVRQKLLRKGMVKHAAVRKI